MRNDEPVVLSAGTGIDSIHSSSGRLARLGGESKAALRDGNIDSGSGSAGVGRVQPKASWAIRVWFLVVAMVLVTLWVQTKAAPTVYNFLIEADREAVGATIALDGIVIGKIDEVSENGIRLYAYRSKISDGNHSLQVSKPGFKPFQKNFDFSGVHYLKIRLPR
jgi:hypothetical protein